MEGEPSTGRGASDGVPSASDGVSRTAGALCGVAAGAVALSLAEIGGKLVDGAAPPLQVLGDWVIRVTPISITEGLIRQVGRHDKQVLLASMLVVAIAAAALIGVRFARGRTVEALVGIGLLAVLPALAAISRPATSIGAELLVLIPAGLLGAAVLQVLGKPLLRPAAQPVASQPSALPGGAKASKKTANRKAAEQKAAEHAALVNAGVARRQLLTAAVVLAGAATIGVSTVRRLSRPSMALMSRLKAALPLPSKPLPPLVDEFAAKGASPLTTPVGDFYRIDIASTPPMVDPETWKLTLSRDGKELRTYRYDELLSRSVTQADITIGCVSNEIGGDLVGTARWQGILLGDLLREAGITSAGRVSGVSVDGFLVSFAGHYAFDGRPAMVAMGMNGDVLPLLHGFPARLVVPGLYGYTSATKWLEQIDVSDSTDLPGFWADRGWAPAVEVHVMSRIDSPHDSVRAGLVTVAGVAWAPTSGVGTVEVQVDDGPWQPAQLSTKVSGVLWRQWVLPWQATPGKHRLTVRATDADGRAQETRRAPVYPSGATGLHQVSVHVR